jgi:DNA-directed RNA polymerase subunit E'/Rpb7
MEAGAKNVQIQNKNKRREVKISSVYSRCLITRNIVLPITAVGKNILEVIEQNVSINFEGKCIVEGFVKPESTKIITYSSGIINRGINISFQVVFECDVCFPVEGMLISCVAKNITKAGIRADSADAVPSPVIVFVAKDHNYTNDLFAEIKEGDKFNVRVIGQRFELNDKYVSIIGELVKPKIIKENNYDYKKHATKDTIKEYSKPKIVIED